MWDSFNEKDVGVSVYDTGQEEVKRVKRTIEDMDVKTAAPKDASLLDEGEVGDKDLNFRRQVKRNVNGYKYRTVYNVGKTKYPYLLTRNSTVMMLEEHLGVEILAVGTYRPEELNGDTEDEDALLLEVSAPTPNKLQDAMFKLSSIIKSSSTRIKNYGVRSIANHAYVNGVQHHTSRMSLAQRYLENEEEASRIRKGLSSISLENLVEIRIRGRCSGYVESCFGEESNEPPYIQIISKSKSSLKSIKDACRAVISGDAVDPPG